MKSVLSSIKKNEETAEEMRLLYVALTRAREKVYVSGVSKSITDFEASSFNCFAQISGAMVRACTSYLNMIALGYGADGEKYWNHEKIGIYDNVQEENADEVTAVEEFINNDEVNSRLSFEYPYINSVNIPNKASVSSLNS